ncbi:MULTISPECIES: hypothetical protein [Sphingomonas]|uniref:Putative membrane-anchored protein n=1 Tax=Sphingomonas kyeonggiensis TaxID=1268553 RepID=A0A7W7K3A8_9SPHN|nr:MULTISPECIES: hypothetical protein [Sphingomonas]MBB4839545.1 putative membrane-anchored protein [Sphingomonas kyeonggiensis]WHU03242.1 hypothetical protein O3305_01105 [Sphingomonas sp. NIBR02145]
MLRQVHRWSGFIFSIAAVVNIIAVILQANAQWLGLLAVLPLLVLLPTGLYMFAKPYFARNA